MVEEQYLMNVGMQ